MRELYQVWPSALNVQQVDRITKIGLQCPMEDATLFSSTEILEGVRSCTVRWVEDQWIQSLLWPYVSKANEKGFQVAVERRSEMADRAMPCR